MTALFSAELLKLRTTRALRIAVGVVLALAVALAVANGLLAGDNGVAPLTARSLRDVVKAPVQLAGAAVLLIGLLAAAGEFRHRTVFLTRLAEPRSPRVLAAKLAAIAVVGLVVGVALDVVSVVAGAVLLQANDLPVHLTSYGVPRLLVLTPLVIALYGVFGVTVGTVVRSTAGAVGATLVWAFVIEGVIPLVTGSPGLAQRLPSGAFQAVLHEHATGGGPAPVVAAGLLVGYAVALLLAALLVDARRELR
ncbi:MAG: type transport system permease protein [Actinomycetota bacterium]|jgi:ABC-2 type transport system permease protein|nr:type transport system permease protein [Actinomycetota bacterium]